MDGDEVVVVTGTAQDIPRLRPLWVAVHHHHQEAMPQLAPYVDDDTTWDERSSLYRDLLAKPDTILLIAQVAARMALALVDGKKVRSAPRTPHVLVRESTARPKRGQERAG